MVENHNHIFLLHPNKKKNPDNLTAIKYSGISQTLTTDRARFVVR